MIGYASAKASSYGFYCMERVAFLLYHYDDKTDAIDYLLRISSTEMLRQTIN